MSPLTDQQRVTLVELLDARERALLSVVREHVAQLRDSSSADTIAPTGDRADQAEMELVRHVRALRDVGGALARLDSSTAGVCIDCGGEICFEQLLAQPTALRCVYCQVIYEQTPPPVLDLAA